MKSYLFLIVLTLFPGCKEVPEKNIIYRISEEANEIFSDTASIELVASGFVFTEGPAWSPDGYLYFSDVRGDKIYRLDENDKPHVYSESTGNSNGLGFLPDGRLVGCQVGARGLSIFHPDGTISPFVQTYRGMKFNSPNDLCVHPDGHVFFSDPPWALPKKFDDPAKEIPFSGVFLVRNTGELEVIDSLLELPNGLALSPDNKYLYVGENKCGGNVDNRKQMPRLWMRYTLDSNLQVSHREEFIFAPDSLPFASPDGMKVDKDGNLFATGEGGLHVFSSEGKHLALIKAGRNITNCVFGGKNRDVLYITSGRSIYRIKLKSPRI